MAKENSTKAISRTTASQINPLIGVGSHTETLEKVSVLLKETAFLMSSLRDADKAALNLEALALINEVAAAAVGFEAGTLSFTKYPEIKAVA